MANEKCTDILALQRGIESIDGMSQRGFSKISSIAKLAIKSVAAGGEFADDFENAFQAIADIADDIVNVVNCEAEVLGCNYIDHAERQRHRAARDAA